MSLNFDLGIEDQAEFTRELGRFTAGDVLTKAARMYADRTAVSDREIELTYAELNERVNAVANALRKRGFAPGEATVSILAENRTEYVETFFVGAKCGFLVPALNWRLEREELIHCVDLVEPDVLVVSGRYREKAEWIENDAASNPLVVTLDDVDGDVAYDDLVAEGTTDSPAPDYDVDPEQGLAILYTSGTTGLPKGVVISHRAWITRGQKYIVDFDLQKGDCQIAWPPLFHIVSADWIPAVFTMGGTFYPVDSFETERIVEILNEDSGGIGWLVLLPGVVETLLEYIEEHDVDVEEFRAIRNVGALVDLVDPKKVERVTETFDMPFKNSYGATEMGNVLSAGNDIPVGVRPGDEDLRKVESSFTDLKLIDEDWNEVENSGELAARGPALCSGYIQNADANRDDFRDGWFRSGDIFEYNDDGTYSFVNRRKYLIKSGGENIYPAEIEKILLEHDYVDEAIVVRVPDEKWGEVPRAVIGSASPEKVSEAELQEMLDAELASYKLPHYVDVVDVAELPRSATGKVVREDVEAWEVRGERIREV